MFLAIPVNMYRSIDVIKSGGIEICGMKASLAPRRQQSQAAPKLEKYTFVPFVSDKVIDFKGICIRVIRGLLQSTEYNNSKIKMFSSLIRTIQLLTYNTLLHPCSLYKLTTL